MQNFLTQTVVQLPKPFMCTFRLKQGLKLNILGRKVQNFLRQGGIQPPKLINTCQFRLKKGLKLSVLAHQMQNFLRPADVQPPKSLRKLKHLDKNRA